MPSEITGPEDLFKCQKCGDCCIGYGGTYVTEKDIINIATYTGTPPENFIKEFCQISGGKPVLAQTEDKYCIFWDGLCKIHPVKPKMCRDWPFIDSILIDAKNWEIMAAVCPGIQTSFPSHLVIDYIKRMLQVRDY